MKTNAKSLWLLFCQTVVVLAAAAFVWQLFGRAPPADSYNGVVARALSSVVGIYGRNEADLVDINNTGAGVAVDERHILTNYHIIANMGFIEADIGGERRAAEVVGVAPEIDLAVLQISGMRLSAIPFAEDGALKQGDIVFAVGNPFGLNRSVSMGIVSALGRREIGMNILEDYIQTDAAINPGNSGGALINANGELVGINSAVYSRRYTAQGIGFAVPSGVVRRSLDDFVPPPHLPEGNHFGAEVRPMSERLHLKILGRTPPHTPVMLVSRIWRGTPAEKMGLKPGDIVLEIDEEPPQTLSENGRLPLSLQSIVVLRAGERRRLALPPPSET